MPRIRSRRLPVALCAIGAASASAAVASLAIGAIPDAQGVIHGCYRAHGHHAGALRVISSPDAAYAKPAGCRRGERPVSWSASGASAAALPDTLPTGSTLRGVYVAAHQGVVSFPIALAREPAVHVIGIGAPSTPECPGNKANPQATSGNLCVYAALGVVDPSFIQVGNPLTMFPGSSRFGFRILDTVSEVTSFSQGTWAVTG